jgi:hypothetical protein
MVMSSGPPASIAASHNSNTARPSSCLVGSRRPRLPATNDPVRINLELFIALRNKVEHRYEHALRAAAGGRAHAFVINFEQELVANFGSEHSLADQLRFPLFVESITAPERKDTIKATRAPSRADRPRQVRCRPGL